MSPLRELYQEMVFDHYKRPRNCHAMSDATCHAQGYNPLCGDKVTVYLKLEQGRVADVSFEGSGCAISTASASLMTEALRGKSVDQVEALFRGFHAMVTDSQEASHPEMEKLEVLSGVREFPARVKCATLAWHTLHAALAGEKQPVSTE